MAAFISWDGPEIFDAVVAAAGRLPPDPGQSSMPTGSIHAFMEARRKDLEGSFSGSDEFDR